MRELALIYSAAVVQMALFAGASWYLARAVGARVTEIAFGVPTAMVVRSAKPKVRVGPIPSGAVTLFGRAADDEADMPGSWRRLGLRSRMLVILGPWFAIVAIAMVCLGPERALRSFAHGFDQWLFTLDLAPLLQRLLDLAETAPFYTLLGVILAKAAALNLLPIGGFAGGGVLQELTTTRTRQSPGWFTGYFMVTLLVSLLWIGGRFGWAVIRMIRD